MKPTPFYSIPNVLVFLTAAKRCLSNKLFLATALAAGFSSYSFGQTTYWIPTMESTATEEVYVYGTKLPEKFGEALAPKGQIVTHEIEGLTHRFIDVSVDWDTGSTSNPAGQGIVSIHRKGKGVGQDWLPGIPQLSDDSAAVKALNAAVSKDFKSWRIADLLILIADGEGNPNLKLRLPISEENQIKARMRTIAESTRQGQYFPKQVQIPTDLDAMRREILALGNLGRRDPNYRKNNKVANDLSGDMTTSRDHGLEKIFKNNPTPPYFNDLVLHPKLNLAAQYMAEYYAKTDGNAGMPYDQKHDAPGEVWAGAKMDKVGDRGRYFAPGVTSLQEGLGGPMKPDGAPELWMKSETHYRPWFNIKSEAKSMGLGVARTKKGWFFCKLSGGQLPDSVGSPAQSGKGEDNSTTGTAVTKVGKGTIGGGEKTKVGKGTIGGRPFDPLNTGGTPLPSPGEKSAHAGSDNADPKWIHRRTLDYSHSVSSVDFMPVIAKQHLAIGLDNGHVIRRAGADNVVVMDAHTDRVTIVKWSPNGAMIASASDDKTVKIWQAANGKMLHDLTGHTDKVHAISWSPDGKKIVSGSPDNSVRIWDVSTGANLKTHTLPSSPSFLQYPRVEWSPDGTKLAAHTNAEGIFVWDNTGKHIRTFGTYGSGNTRGWAWSPDSTKIAWASDDGLNIGDFAVKQMSLYSKHESRVESVEWSPDGRHIVTTSTKRVNNVKDDAVLIWDATKRAVVHKLAASLTSGLSKAWWSPNSRTIASGAWNGNLLIWDATTGASLATIVDPNPENGAGLRGFSWSPDSRHIATAKGDHTVRISVEVARGTHRR